MQLRASAGKGYRFIQQFWAENNNLLAMGREIKETLSKREDAWNFGGTLGFDIPLWNKNLKLNTRYFYTTLEIKLLLTMTRMLIHCSYTT